METKRPPYVDRNRVYRPAAETTARYRIIYGGAGSGKSVAVAQDYVARLSAQKLRLVVFRKVANTIYNSTFTQFKDILSAMGVIDSVQVNETRMSFRFPNGSEILHAGLDDVKKIKSLAKPTHIWIEEATELDFPTSDTQEPDLAQVDLRLRGVDPALVPSLTLTFNPTQAALPIVAYFGIPTADLPSRAHKTYTIDGGAQVYVQHTTYLDNPWVGDDYVAVFRRMGGVMQAVYERGELVAVDAPDQLIRYEWVKAAFERDPSEAHHDGRQRMACDVARFGDDETVITGGTGYALEWVETVQGQDTTTTGRRVASLGRQYGVAAEMVAVDTVGLGSGAADTAASDGYAVTEFVAGASPVKNPDILPASLTFNNLRSQAWWHYRTLLEEGHVSFSADLPADVKRKLQEDLLAPRYRTAQEKRIEVEPKEGTKAWGIKARLGRSPDYGDAEVMRAFVVYAQKPVMNYSVI